MAQIRQSRDFGDLEKKVAEISHETDLFCMIFKIIINLTDLLLSQKIHY